MEDGGKKERPQSRPDKTPEASGNDAGVVGGVRIGSGMRGVLAQREAAIDKVRFRLTGGTQGAGPAAHIAEERRAVVAGAAARILRKGNGDPGKGPNAIPKGGGSGLPANVRAEMEPKLGADLSGVKVHTGGESAKAAQGFNARAFTVGSDIHFSAGQFNPGTKEGDKLLAHELTHVVQGQRSGIQRKEHDAGQEAGEHREDVSTPEEPAEQEADAISEKVAGEIHGDEKEGGGPKDKKAQKKDVGAADKKDPSTPAPSEKPAQISAKLEGVGPKIFRAAPPGAGPGPGPTPPTTPPPFDAARAKQAIDGKAPDCRDLSDKLAPDWVGKTQADFDAAFADVAALKHAVIDKFIGAGPPKAQTQTVGSSDPIAIQKFQDIDAEAHLDPAHGNLKDQFYQKLAAEMQKPTFTDRTRTYPAMKDAVGYAFNMKGKKIPPDRISPLSARNHSVDKLYDINTISADIDAEIERPLRAANARQATIDNNKADDDKRKKAYRHILASRRDPLTTIDKSKPISPFGSWYAPGEIRPNTSAPPNQEFARMMTLGALQPEWYPNGTVVLNIDRRLSGAARNIFKPTAFDGLMSPLWCARNMGADDYGVTGGGVGEFLEANVPFTDVTSATAIVPSDDFVADMQRVVTQVKNELGGASTPTEELMRGNNGNTSILNTTRGQSGVAGMYDQVIGRSAEEQRSPSAAPNAPGAVNETSSAMPGAPAVAPGGVFDRR